MENNPHINIPEHRSFALGDSERDKILSERLNSNSYNPENPTPYLGVDWGNREHTEIVANYFVGAQWIEQKKSAIIVTPKIIGLDFFSMFVRCLENRDKDLQGRFSQIYSIDFGQPSIPVKADTFQLTPLLVVHFLTLLESLTRRGLKSNFISREEEMKAKVKGKVLIGRTLKKGVFVGRSDIISCRYQDYSVDCLENRILKKALVFAQRYLASHKLQIRGVNLQSIADRCAASFTDISDSIAPQEIRQFRVNPLFKDYSDTIKVAKQLLQRFDYSIDTTGKKDIDSSVPPFWINMPILFELYVLGELRSTYGSDIKYHLSTYGNELDFARLSEKLIMDTKYIDEWSSEKAHGYIRQLAGYARNVQIRKKMGLKKEDENAILPCIILYPDENGATKFSGEILEMPDRIEQTEYLKFYRLGIKLPKI